MLAGVGLKQLGDIYSGHVESEEGPHMLVGIVDSLWRGHGTVHLF